MPAHPIDFEIQAHVYSTPELLAVFDEKARFGRWLQFEAALAEVQAEMGIIPAEAAVEIGRKARLEHLDLAALGRGYEESRNSLLPVLQALRRACTTGHGDFVHFGATTQDALDTGQALELKETLRIVRRDLRELEALVMDLAVRHRATPMIGRTHGQQALPITFGLKLAVWLVELRRHFERLKALAPRLLAGQLAGAVGTGAALGERAQEVAARTMSRLGLGWQSLPWHTARDSVGELASCFALLTATLAKIAVEIYSLAKTECGELAEPAPRKAMSSSTMPHKRNPVLCQRVAVLGRHVRALTGVVVESMGHEHERDGRALWSEWLAVPQLCIYTGTALRYLCTIVAGLEVRPGRMAENLHRQKDLALSEWLLFRLAAPLGRAHAQERLHDLMSRARATGQPVSQLLGEDPEIGPLLAAEDLETLAHPESYTGQAVRLVDTAVREVTALRAKDPEAS